MPAGKALPLPLAPVNVVVGHYGVGKTNLALNVALDAAAAGHQVILADMDVVNPYFRSSEYRGLLEDAGVRLIAPVFGGAGTALDAPSLTGELTVAAEEAYRDYEALLAEDGFPEGASAKGGEGADAAPAPRKVVVVDAGGDDVGATALARFAPAVAAGPYQMIYVVNAFRNLTQEPHEAVAVLREIESKSRLAATSVVGNSHLQGETTAAHLLRGLAFAQAVAAEAHLPLRCITAPISAIQQENADLAALGEAAEVYPVKVYVKTPWA